MNVRYPKSYTGYWVLGISYRPSHAFECTLNIEHDSNIKRASVTAKKLNRYTLIHIIEAFCSLWSSPKTEQQQHAYSIHSYLEYNYVMFRWFYFDIGRQMELGIYMHIHFVHCINELNSSSSSISI